MTVSKKGSPCTQCNRCFPNARHLARHVQEAHPPQVSTGKLVPQTSRKEKCNEVTKGKQVSGKLFSSKLPSTPNKSKVDKTYKGRQGGVTTCTT